MQADPFVPAGQRRRDAQVNGRVRDPRMEACNLSEVACTLEIVLYSALGGTVSHPMPQLAPARAHHRAHHRAQRDASSLFRGNRAPVDGFSRGERGHQTKTSWFGQPFPHQGDGKVAISLSSRVASHYSLLLIRRHVRERLHHRLW